MGVLRPGGARGSGRAAAAAHTPRTAHQRRLLPHSQLPQADGRAARRARAAPSRLTPHAPARGETCMRHVKPLINFRKLMPQAPARGMILHSSCNTFHIYLLRFRSRIISPTASRLTPHAPVRG